jgi:hypothetical protein
MRRERCAPFERSFFSDGCLRILCTSLTMCSHVPDNISVAAEGIAAEMSPSMEPIIILPFIAYIHRSHIDIFQICGS